MSALIKKYPLPTYFILAFAFTCVGSSVVYIKRTKYRPHTAEKIATV